MDVPVKILYQDSAIVVLDKPANLVVNRAESVRTQTLQDWIEETFPQMSSFSSETEFAARSGMVHRLDKDTSGVILWALTPNAMYGLMKQFKERTILKTYRALIHDRLVPPQGVISVPLGRLPQNRKKFGVVIGGKMTETEYQVEQHYASNKQYPGGFSLVKLRRYYLQLWGGANV